MARVIIYKKKPGMIVIKSMRIKVIAPSRLHLGLLTDGFSQRPWQGIGIAIKEPKTILSAASSELPGLRIAGNFENEIETVLRNFYSQLNTGSGVVLEFIECPPRHVGLGSGTQIILSATTSISILTGISMSVEDIAIRTNRGRYSWIGVEAFKNGGFIICLGRGKDIHAQPVIRLDFPEEWFIVLSIPRGRRGVSGFVEESALSQIRYSKGAVTTVYTYLMNMVLPGLIEHDLELFGKGVELIQRLIGDEFKGIQGGVFNPASADLVELMRDAGLHGVGQSSWGPTIYGFTDKREDALRAVQLVKDLKPDVDVFVTTAENKGARIIYS